MKKTLSFLQNYVTPLVVLILVGVVVTDHMGLNGPTGPQRAVNGRALGRSYAPMVVANLADAWLAAAEALERGKTVSESQEALQQTWQEARIKAFTTKVAPEFIKVLPEGQEPTDPSSRAEVVRVWRDFAAGLKGGR